MHSRKFRWICTGRGEHRAKILDTMEFLPIGVEGFAIWDDDRLPEWEEMEWVGNEKESHQMMATGHKKGRPILRQHVELRATSNGYLVSFSCRACGLSHPIIISELGLKQRWELARQSNEWQADISF
jgi:hypothetical protein